MGTHFYFDRMLPASDREAGSGGERQLEILTPSGTNEIWLRLGRLNSQDDGDGFTVQLSRKAAADLIEGLESAVFRLDKFLK